MNILAIGDIFGRPGRTAFLSLLPKIISQHKVDFVIANAENAAGGKGLTQKVADEIFTAPVNVLTAGNHIWERDEINKYFETHAILRPFNVHESLPGRGYGIFAAANGARIAVISLQGTVFMDGKGRPAESPFKAMDGLLPLLKNRCDIIIIDFHAEATSEKRALAWYLNGRVTAIVGTHTHVQTADEEILPKGTAFITDLGMTGPHNSVVGLDIEVAMHRYLTGDKRKFKVAEGDVHFEGVVIDVDESRGLARSIKRIREKFSA